MRDAVTLSVNDHPMDRFESYSVDSDLFQAASSFTFDCFDSASFVEPGMQAKLFVNKICEMNGIVDRVETSYEKGENKLVVSGRDMMGLLCDHCCEDFGEITSLNGKTAQYIAETLIQKVPFIKKEDIVYQPGAGWLDKIWNFEKINPGETVFEVLKRIAIGRGLLFYCLPDGTFVFGKPKEKGPAAFNIISAKKGVLLNNVINGKLTRDISQCYSKVTVLGCVQGMDNWGTPETLKVKGVAFVPGNVVPFYKPLVHHRNKDKVSPKREAEWLAGQQIAKSFVLEYTVPFHGQAGSNWKINELCAVQDDNFIVAGAPVRDVFLVYGRTFARDKKNGTTTTLRLGYPGVVISD